jgi:hypothetical protein
MLVSPKDDDPDLLMLKNKNGWILIAVITINILVNILIVSYEAATQIYQAIKDSYYSIKL